jgi:hypothetical protein
VAQKACAGNAAGYYRRRNWSYADSGLAFIFCAFAITAGVFRADCFFYKNPLGDNMQFFIAFFTYFT